MNKVIQGTPNFSRKSLCETCRMGIHIRGESSSQEFIHCRWFEGEVPFKVAECNWYQERTSTPLHEMEEIAWKFATDRSKKTIGFFKPSEYRQKLGNGDIE